MDRANLFPGWQTVVLSARLQPSHEERQTLHTWDDVPSEVSPLINLPSSIYAISKSHVVFTNFASVEVSAVAVGSSAACSAD